MWIKGIELENFQKHEKFSAEFTEGVNVLVGETDAGKSAIVRAIKWVMFNEPKGDVVRRIGSDRTLATLILNDGTSVRRIKSSTENAYSIIRGDEEKRFDAIGKAVPEAVRTLLGVAPMNVDGSELILSVAPQIALPFLLSDSGTFRMKIFNKLTGNDILDKVSQSVNKDSLRVKRERKIREEDLSKTKDEYESVYDQFKSKKKVFEEVSGILKKTQKKAERIETVEEYQSRLKNKRVALSEARKRFEAIKYPEPAIVGVLKSRSDKIGLVSRLVQDSGEKRALLSSVTDRLDRVKTPKTVDSLKSRATTLKSLTHLTVERRSKVDLYGTMGEKLGIIDARLKEESKLYRDKLKESGSCPICKTKITDEVLRQIKM